jgi:L-alanine-DL-glutamate epimerase-like enolase superfamily enzyme
MNPSLPALAISTPASTDDRITWARYAYIAVPLAKPASDAKVFTGRQHPLDTVAILIAEIGTRDSYHGLGFSYAKRAGGPALYAHAAEIAPNLLDEDPNDIARLWEKLQWAGASVGRGGLAIQAIAAFDIALWDLKARRASLPLAKLLGAYRDSVRCYNTSGGFLSSSLEEILENTDAAIARGIGGIKIKVGHPNAAVDLERVTAVRKHLGDAFPLMVDANQQWDRTTAYRLCCQLETFNLTWIEEPVDCQDVEGHAQLAANLLTPIASGEMLSSTAEHIRFLERGAVDILQPDAPRVGGITPFLKISTLADHYHTAIAPHFAMEIHLHLAAIQPRESWVEHFNWLEPLFNERLEIQNGCMLLPSRPGLGISLSEQAKRWEIAAASVGKCP